MISEMEMIIVPTHKYYIFSSVKNLESILLYHERKCACVCAKNSHSNRVSTESIFQ